MAPCQPSAANIGRISLLILSITIYSLEICLLQTYNPSNILQIKCVPVPCPWWCMTVSLPLGFKDYLQLCNISLWLVVLRAINWGHSARRLLCQESGRTELHSNYRGNTALAHPSKLLQCDKSHFWMQFLKWMIFIKSSLKFAPGDPIDNKSTLVDQDLWCNMVSQGHYGLKAR